MPAQAKFADDVATTKFGDDIQTLKFRDDLPTIKFRDDIATLKFRDDQETLKFADDPKLKFADDPKLKFADDPLPKAPADVPPVGPGGPGLGPLGPGQRSGAAAAPYKSATPHHSMAWASSFPDAFEARLAEAREQIHEYWGAIGERADAQRRGLLTADEVQQLHALRMGYAAVLAENQDMLRHATEQGRRADEARRRIGDSRDPIVSTDADEHTQVVVRASPISVPRPMSATCRDFRER